MGNSSDSSVEAESRDDDGIGRRSLEAGERIEQFQKEWVAVMAAVVAGDRRGNTTEA